MMMVVMVMMVMMVTRVTRVMMVAANTPRDSTHCKPNTVLSSFHIILTAFYGRGASITQFESYRKGDTEQLSDLPKITQWELKYN